MDAPIACPVCNVSGLECKCEQWFCEHGRPVCKDWLYFYWNVSITKNHWYDVGGCPCGANLSDSPDFLQDVRSALEKKPPALSERRVVKKTSDGDSPGRWYMITFTQPDTILEPHDLLKRTMKVIRSRMVSPNQWCYSLELTEKGIPHTHIRLHTDRYFDYKKIGNFNSGYRYDVQQEKFQTGFYVVKEDTKPSDSWLSAYGLTGWFWSSENYSGPRPAPRTVHLPDLPNLISHV